MPRRARSVRRDALLVAAASVVAAALLACGGDAGKRAATKGPPPPVVEVATVERTAVDAGLSLIGQLEPWESVMLRPETEGLIESVEFEEGQEVEKGAVLFRLRDDWQRARVREAEANIALTERAFGRANELAGKRIMAASELDEATASRNAAHARLDLARVELERMTIRAPFHGIVGQRLVSPGDRIDDKTDLAQIDAVASLRLAFALPEPIVDLVRNGTPLELSVAAYPGEWFPGRVYFVAPSLDPKNRHLLLKAAVENPDRRLRPGMFANLRLAAAGNRPDVLAAPESSVVADPAGSYVYRVASDGTAERVTVELGQRQGGKVEVKRGLAEGDRVVSAGTNKVVPGAPVEVAEANATTDASRGAGAEKAAEATVATPPKRQGS